MCPSIRPECSRQSNNKAIKSRSPNNIPFEINLHFKIGIQLFMMRCSKRSSIKYLLIEYTGLMYLLRLLESKLSFDSIMIQKYILTNRVIDKFIGRAAHI